MTVEWVASLRRYRQTVVAGPKSGLPATVEEAYRLSGALVQQSGETVGAWKLGGATAGTRAAFKTDKVYYGAVLASEVHFKPSHLPFMLTPLRGEAEIALRVAYDLQEAADFADAAASVALFDVFAPAIECPWSVFSNLPTAGLPALLSDRCATGMLLLGGGRRIDVEAMNAPISIVGGEVCLAEGRADQDLLMSPVEIALEAVAIILATGGAIKAGQWISTGGITRCVDLPADEAFSLVFDGVKEFTVTPVGDQ